MATEQGRRKKKPKAYEIVSVPLGDAGTTRRLRAGRGKLFLIALGIFCSVVALTLAVLMFTPLTAYIPIPNPALERKYGRQAVETQRQLLILAEQVMLLKDYNHQLRRALGEEVSGDSVASSRPVADSRTQRQEQLASRNLDHNTTVGSDEPYSPPPFTVVEARTGGFRASFPLMVPTSGFVTQGFDPSRKHFGMDYATKRGTPVYAASDGYVVFAGWTYDDGNMIMLSHGSGYLTVYKHNQSLLQSVHTYVKRGEPVALIGTSGRTSLGPHLHFEVWKDGIPHDPNEYLLNPPTIQ
ncbi:MAG: M23 family metallopeptidase [Ignavibacteria bacterium]|nr:M23 family metallopeptidase [Ignavibacteria bacterium]